VWTENSSYQNSIINQSTSETGNDNNQCRLNSLEEEKQSAANVDDTNAAVEMTVVQQPGNQSSSDGTIDIAADDNGSHHVVIATTTIMDAPPPEAVPSAVHDGGGGYSDAAYRIRLEAEIREELAHPDDVFITEAQYKLDRECAEFAARAHLEGKTMDLQVAKTAFYLSSFHFKDSNHSMTLYTDPSPGARRQEWVDFVRRRNDGYVLHLWDQRIAIMLTLKNSATNTFQPRFFVAMTNLYMQLGGGKVHKELVLLDILVRMDVHSHVDALVGVIATGEVRLWKHSKDHLRFLHCDFMNEVERGEDFWIARRQQFYEEKGLIFLPQRMIPRDLDAPKSRFAISKEYITSYKHVYSSESEVLKNFDKWTLVKGRFRSLKEFADTADTSSSRHNTINAAADKQRSDQKAKEDERARKQQELSKKRWDTRRKNQEEKRKEDERKLLGKLHGEKRAAAPPSYFGFSQPPVPFHLPPPALPPASVKSTKASQQQLLPNLPVRDLTRASPSSSMTENTKLKVAGAVRRREQPGNIELIVV
jgi:hypothetical protein